MEPQPPQGVSVVVRKPETGEVLLHKREDFRVWSLPGGRVEPGETWEEAAVRETFEETGHRIAVERLIGRYRRPQMPDDGLNFVALGRLLSDSASPEPFGWETLAVGWFPADALPRGLSRFARAYIADALAGRPESIERTLCIPAHEAAAMRLLFRLRSLRNRLLRRP